MTGIIALHYRWWLGKVEGMPEIVFPSFLFMRLMGKAFVTPFYSLLLLISSVCLRSAVPFTCHVDTTAVFKPLCISPHSHRL